MSKDRLEEMSSFFDSRADIYDINHISDIDGGIESKNILATFMPMGTERILDFGIGTGLELVEIIKRFPNIEITGIDISANMLKKIGERFSQNNIRIFCGDYLKLDFGNNYFDVVLSSMTLHHYNHTVKLDLYKKIYRCLSETGIYIENDYMLSEHEFIDPQKQEDNLFSEYEKLKNGQHLESSTYYHFDTPCTVENQKKLLLSAGFFSVKEVWRKKNNVTLLARKGNDLEGNK